jgi:hypothetical protein
MASTSIRSALSYRRTAGWAACLVLVIASLAVAISNRRQVEREDSQHARDASGYTQHANAEIALERTLSTPKAFIEHCGPLSLQVRGVLARGISEKYFTPTAPRIDTLIYALDGGTMDVILSIMMREHHPFFRGKFAPTLPEEGMEFLHCKA